MKKTLVALAAVSAVSAFAQSSVTVFGVVDVAQVSKTHTALDGTVLSKTSGITDGFNAGNRVGFRGTEDLGGGMSANFWVESALNITNGALWTRVAAPGQPVDGLATSGGTHSNMPTGAYNSSSTNRQSWVGLKSGMGEVRLGYQYTNLYEVSTLSGYHFGSEQPGGDMAHGTMSNAYFGGTRANGVTYISPSYNGFTLRGQYGSGAQREEVVVSTGTASPNGSPLNTLNSRRGLLLRYAQGPIDGSIAYTTYKAETAAVSSSTINTTTGVLTGGTTNIWSALSATSSAAATTQSNNLLQAAGTYQLGSSTKLSYSYAKGNITDSTTTTISATTKANQYGIEYTMGSIRPFLITGTGKITQNSNSSLIQDAKTTQYGVRYDLSKRTVLYGISGTATDGGTSVTSSTIAKRTATAIGLYHSF